MFKVHNGNSVRTTPWNSITVSFVTSSILYSKQSLPQDVHMITVYPFMTTNVLLTWQPTQQLLTVLLFLVKFKTLGSTVEPGLENKLCANALSNK